MHQLLSQCEARCASLTTTGLCSRAQTRTYFTRQFLIRRSKAQLGLTTLLGPSGNESENAVG